MARWLAPWGVRTPQVTFRLKPTHRSVGLDVGRIHDLGMSAHQALLHTQADNVGKAGLEDGCGQALPQARDSAVLRQGLGKLVAQKGANFHVQIINL